MSRSYCLILLLLSTILFAQNDTTKLNYTCKDGLFSYRDYDEHGHLIEKERRIFYFLFKRSTVIEYYCNGKKKLKSHFIQVTGGRGFECLVYADMECGIWKYWNENGKLCRKEKYKGGEIKRFKEYGEKKK